MSWFKKKVEDWDMVGRTVAEIPPSVDWEDDEDEEGNEVEIIEVKLKDNLIDLGTDPNAELLEKLKTETEKKLQE